MSVKRDPGGSYLRDADAVGLVVKSGCVVIHIPDLYVHLPCDHLAREGGGAGFSVGIGPWPLSAQGPRTLPPRTAGASGDTHPLMVADRELHCELRLGLKEKGGRETAELEGGTMMS